MAPKILGEAELFLKGCSKRRGKSSPASPSVPVGCSGCGRGNSAGTERTLGAVSGVPAPAVLVFLVASAVLLASVAGTRCPRWARGARPGSPSPSSPSTGLGTGPAPAVKGQSHRESGAALDPSLTQRDPEGSNGLLPPKSRGAAGGSPSSPFPGEPAGTFKT